jgi:hypothetical protein
MTDLQIDRFDTVSSHRYKLKGMFALQYCPHVMQDWRHSTAHVHGGAS